MNLSTRPSFTDMYPCAYTKDRKRFVVSAMRSWSYALPDREMNEVELICGLDAHADLHDWLVRIPKGRVSVHILGEPTQGPTSLNTDRTPPKGLLLCFETEADLDLFEKTPR